MSISVVRCSHCRQPLQTPFGAFTYTLRAEAKKHCQHCGASGNDARNRAWFFCSAECFRAGVGEVVLPSEEVSRP